VSKQHLKHTRKPTPIGGIFGRGPSFCLALVLLVSVLLSIVAAPDAEAVDLNFAGSAQADYHLVGQRRIDRGSSQVFDGFTLEAGLKLSVDVSDHFSANVKLCMGCHGLETDMAYADYRVADELNFRLGRFSPSFGSFNLRHDPANHRTSDKPLAYDMGRMIRMRDWNFGVMPSPFPDNGLEINGTHWFGSKVQLDYAAYAVSGFKADADAMDLDFIQSRSGSLYYVDNNSQPAVGGRLALTARLGKRLDATLGTSFMGGTFDPDAKHKYLIFGGDLSFRLGRTNLRFEYLARRQDFDTSNSNRFKYALEPGANYFVKHGAYGELEVPVSSKVDVLGRFDVLFRKGNVLESSPLSASSAVVRYTLGTAVSLERGLRLKYSVELWSFSDPTPSGGRKAVTSHLGLVGAF
jgi:hypothetical protein